MPNLAQATPVGEMVAQGRQMVVNGQSLPGAWTVRQGRIGVADVDLAQTLGINLLSNTAPQQQPVQWFTEPLQQPLVLGSWLTPQHRYVDMTDLVRSLGWNVSVNGPALQIATPRGQIANVRHGKQTWGDRLVVDLSGPVPWRVAEDATSFTVTLDGAVDPAIAQQLTQALNRQPRNLITALTISTVGDRTQIRADLSARLRSRISMLPNPARLVIDVRSDSMVERTIYWAPGLTWRQQYVGVGAARFPVYLLELDPRQPGLALRPIWTDPETAVGTAPLIRTAQRWQVAAAINAGFFNRNNQLPLGAIRTENRWVSGPILGRGAVGWSGAGNLLMSRLVLREAVSPVVAGAVGDRLPVLSLNSGLVGAGICRYTREWGSTYTPITEGETVVTVRNNQVVARQVVPSQSASTPLPGGIQPPAEISRPTFPIPSDGYLLVLRGNDTLVNAFVPGSSVRYEAATLPAEFDGFPNILGAGPLLVQNSQIVLDARAEGFSDAFIQELAIRSAIGKRPEGTLFLAAVHPRVGGPGPSLGEMAQVMQRLGSVAALNLDGGSSTSLYLGGQLINRPASTVGRVHNAIGIFLQNPQ
ncbi:MAG: phosphodiester glycosidase family protein [Elainellaceae cyanobacterium]